MSKNINQYQSVAGKSGSSKSEEKWEALKINDLTGLTVLDLGCNEGFFVEKALSVGASNVVGVDLNLELIEKAQKRLPSAVFINVNWEEYLDQAESNSFDVVIMLSALHYSKNYTATLRKIARVLKVGGRLILECSLYPSIHACHYIPVTRGKPPLTDTVYHFTRSKFKEVASDSFFIRFVGKSVLQPGDPIPRFIYNLYPKKPFCILVSGRSGSGKSALSDLISSCSNFNIVSLDEIILSLAQLEFTNIGKVLGEKNQPGRIDILYKELASSGYIKDFINYILRECEGFQNVIIEGFLLEDKVFREVLSENLSGSKGYLVKELY